MLNTKQVAEKLGVSERTIERWMTDRKIPYYRLNGIIRFDEAVIDSWVQKRQVRTKNIN